jgi:hypothetical protein
MPYLPDPAFFTVEFNSLTFITSAMIRIREAYTFAIFLLEDLFFFSGQFFPC